METLAHPAVAVLVFRLEVINCLASNWYLFPGLRHLVVKKPDYISLELKYKAYPWLIADIRPQFMGPGAIGESSYMQLLSRLNYRRLILRSFGRIVFGLYLIPAIQPYPYWIHEIRVWRFDAVATTHYLQDRDFGLT